MNHIPATTPMFDFNHVCKRAVTLANKIDGDLELVETLIGHYGYGDAIFGIEYVECADRTLAYINTGDTYSLTVGEEDGKLFDTSWGDWYEGAEEEYCEEHNAIRCGYCGEFTDCAENWRETICGSCGKNVDG